MMTQIQHSGLMSQDEPTTLAEAAGLMVWLSIVFDGGFHPEDDPAEIENSDGQVFDEVAATRYRELLAAAVAIFEAEGVDVCDVALRAGRGDVVLVSSASGMDD